MALWFNYSLTIAFFGQLFVAFVEIDSLNESIHGVYMLQKGVCQLG